jgi:capsular polysaccharide biosynthesis protein
VEEEISLVEIGQVLIKRWKLLFFLPLLAAVIAYVASSFLITPLYVSSSTLIVMPFTETLEGGSVVRHDIATTRQVVQSCRELTLSLDSLQRVIGELNLPYTANQLLGNLEITVNDVTSVSATDASPMRAFEIASHVTNVLMEYITDTARLENVQLLNPAQVPTAPVNQRSNLNMAVAFVLALMVAVALAFLFEHLDNTIKTSDDVQKYLGVPVLGVIPEFEEEGRR